MFRRFVNLTSQHAMYPGQLQANVAQWPSSSTSIRTDLRNTFESLACAALIQVEHSDFASIP